VEAFIVCSACRISEISKIRAQAGGGTFSVSMYRKFSAKPRSSRGATASSPRRRRACAATIVGAFAISRTADQ
jgi:hypothetical protein